MIKRGIIDNSSDKTQFLIKENGMLKDKINEMERSFKENPRERELENQRDALNYKVEQLAIENEKLRNMAKDTGLNEQNG